MPLTAYIMSHTYFLSSLLFSMFLASAVGSNQWTDFTGWKCASDAGIHPSGRNGKIKRNVASEMECETFCNLNVMADAMLGGVGAPDEETQEHGPFTAMMLYTPGGLESGKCECYTPAEPRTASNVAEKDKEYPCASCRDVVRLADPVRVKFGITSNTDDWPDHFPLNASSWAHCFDDDKWSTTTGEQYFCDLPYTDAMVCPYDLPMRATMFAGALQNALYSDWDLIDDHFEPQEFDTGDWGRFWTFGTSPVHAFTDPYKESISTSDGERYQRDRRDFFSSGLGQGVDPHPRQLPAYERVNNVFACSQNACEEKCTKKYVEWRSIPRFFGGTLTDPTYLQVDVDEESMEQTWNMGNGDIDTWPNADDFNYFEAINPSYDDRLGGTSKVLWGAQCYCSDTPSCLSQTTDVNQGACDSIKSANGLTLNISNTYVGVVDRIVRGGGTWPMRADGTCSVEVAPCPHGGTRSAGGSCSMCAPGTKKVGNGADAYCVPDAVNVTKACAAKVFISNSVIHGKL